MSATSSPVTELYGSNVFSEAVMQSRLPKNIFKALKRTMREGAPLDPAVADVAVIAVPAESGGEDEIKACIVLKDGQTADYADIIRWCEPRLPYFAVPRYLEFMDKFPRTPSEKIQKNLLRDAGFGPNCWDRIAAGVELQDEIRRNEKRQKK